MCIDSSVFICNVSKSLCSTCSFMAITRELPWNAIFKAVHASLAEVDAAILEKIVSCTASWMKNSTRTAFLCWFYCELVSGLGAPFSTKSHKPSTMWFEQRCHLDAPNFVIFTFEVRNCRLSHVDGIAHCFSHLCPMNRFALIPYCSVMIEVNKSKQNLCC